MKENYFFKEDRLFYTKYDGFYALGTFINRDYEELRAEKTYMKPSMITLKMFEQLRSKAELEPFLLSYAQEAKELYTTSCKGVGMLLSRELNRPIAIVGEGAEFLEGIGNREPAHTIRLVEAVDPDGTLHYLIIGGRAPIEVKSDVLSNATHIDYNDDVFKVQENELVYSELSFAKFTLALIEEYFGRKVILDDLTSRTNMFWVDGPFYDLDNLPTVLHTPYNLAENRYAMMFSTNLNYEA